MRQPRAAVARIFSPTTVSRPSRIWCAALQAVLCLAVLCLTSGCQDGGEAFRRSLRDAARGVGEKPARPSGKKKAAPLEETAESGESTEPGEATEDSGVIGNKIQKAAAAQFQILCSPGGRLNGTPPPKGWSMWCEKKTSDGKIVKHDGAVSWHRNQVVSVRANYFEGKRHGRYETFFRSGEPQEIRTYQQGKLSGPVIRFTEQGQKLSETSYYNGKKHGPYRKWSRAGTLLEEGSHFQDVKHGAIKRFYRSGLIRSTTEFRNGVKHGKFKEVNERGRVKTIGAYRENKPHGKWQSYGRSGHVNSSGEYRNGKKHGLWLEYDRNGQVKQRQVYADGRVSSSRNAAPQTTEQSGGWQPL